MLEKRKYLIVFFLIFLIAAFLRFWKLTSLPPGIWPDEAAYAKDGLETLKTGSLRVFYPDNHGREGLFMWLLAFSFWLFGVSILSFKIVPATLGLFTILGQYLFCREIFLNLKFEKEKAEKIALLSAFFLSISFWHLNFSRIGFRAILAPLILVFSFYFLFRALRTKKTFDFILAGSLFALGFYSYISFRLAVIPLFFILTFWFFVALKEKAQRQYLFSVSLLIFFLFLFSLPIGIYFLKNPQDFVSRAIGVSIFEQTNPLMSFLKSLTFHLLMFNFRGDYNWRHNISGYPQLNILEGIFFLFGLFLLFYQIINLWRNPSLEYRREKIIIFSFLFIYFFSLLLPAVLTIEGIPHALRSIGVIPVVYLFSAFGAFSFYEWLKKKLKFSFLNYISLLILFLMFLSSFWLYFFYWAKSPKLEEAFSVRLLDLGNELNKIPLERRKYVIMNEGDLAARVPQFIQATKGREEAIYIDPKEIENTNFQRGDLIFLMNKDESFFLKLKEKFPQGLIHQKERIIIFEVP